MITERTFAASFHDFWRELLPLLTPSCVHLLNAGHEEHLLDEHGAELDTVATHEDTRDAAIVSEFAYHLARESYTRGLSVSETFADTTVQRSAETAALGLIARYEGKDLPNDYTLNAAELSEGFELASRYESFVRLHCEPEHCIFQAPIKGCGFLHACAADLVIGNHIVEVKTVKRRLAGKDIRQLVIYLALSSVGRDESWEYAGFFNPRRSTFHRFHVHELIDLISGGKSVVEVYSDLLEFICSSDVQLDSVF